MKLTFKKGALATALALVASSAMAADSLDIKVAGKIMPPSCTPTFVSGGGIADFGTIQLSALKSAQPTALPDVKTVPVRINCEQPAYFAVTFKDQRADSRPSSTYGITFTNLNFGTLAKHYFGLGFTNATDKKIIGTYALTIDGNTVKNAAGKTIQVIGSTNMGAGWSTISADSIYADNNGSTIFGFNEDGGTTTLTPDPETEVTFNVNVAAIIESVQNLEIKDQITLDGLASVDLVYL